MGVLGVGGRQYAWVTLMGCLCSLACASEGGDGSDRDGSGTSGSAGAAFPLATGSRSSTSFAGGTGSASLGSGASGAATGGRGPDPSSQGTAAVEGILAANGSTDESGANAARGGGATAANADSTPQGGAPEAATASGADAGSSPDASGEAGRLPLAQAGAPDGAGGLQGTGGLEGSLGVEATGSAGATSTPLGAAGSGWDATGGDTTAGDATGEEGGHSGNAGNAGSQPEGNGGAGNTIVESQVWKDTSVGLNIIYWDGFGGMLWTYEATRDELTTEQVAALEHLVLIEPAELQADCDIDYYALTVTDADGSTNRQTVIAPECWRTPIVTYASFRPFLDTFDCTSDGWEFSDEQSSAGILTPSPCVYQLGLPPYDRYMPDVRWARLAIPNSARCVLSLTGAHLRASIFAPDGETLLLTADALDGDGVVTELEYDYPEAAEYLLLLEPLATESDRLRYELHCDD